MSYTSNSQPTCSKAPSSTPPFRNTTYQAHRRFACRTGVMSASESSDKLSISNSVGNSTSLRTSMSHRGLSLLATALGWPIAARWHRSGEGYIRSSSTDRRAFTPSLSAHATTAPATARLRMHSKCRGWVGHQGRRKRRNGEVAATALSAVRMRKGHERVLQPGGLFQAESWQARDTTSTVRSSRSVVLDKSYRKQMDAHQTTDGDSRLPS